MGHKNYELLKTGHPTALENIHAKYSRQIFWIGKGMINDHFVIESLVQDAFLKLWIHRDRIESPAHIFYFLRFVMKRACISYYTRPKNKFFRNVHSLEEFENYQDYLVGYDPVKDSESLRDQALDQRAFDRIKEVLPLLNAERKHLIELCLKYGFQYKAISEVMGTSSTQTSKEVKRAIQDIKNIIDQGSTLETKQQQSTATEAQSGITKTQERVLQLRCENNCSFASIGIALKLSQKEVHREFMTAYRLMQEKHQQQQSA